MNAIFLSLFLGATAILLFVNPPLFLPTVLEAAGDSATLCIALLASYAVWMGLMEVWKACGITRGIAKLLRPVCKRLFRTEDEPTLQAISANLSCNLLGLGGAAHKEMRGVLLNHLHGFAAFRTTEKMDAHKQKYADLRRQLREQDSEAHQEVAEHEKA